MDASEGARGMGIYDLIVDLIGRSQPPSLVWLVAWSEGGTREPVAAAWDASAWGSAMVAVLGLVGDKRADHLGTGAASCRLAAGTDLNAPWWVLRDGHNREIARRRADPWRTSLKDPLGTPPQITADVQVWCEREVARAVRAIVPVPPTLRDLLAHVGVSAAPG